MISEDELPHHAREDAKGREGARTLLSYSAVVVGVLLAVPIYFVFVIIRGEVEKFPLRTGVVSLAGFSLLSWPCARLLGRQRATRRTS